MIAAFEESREGVRNGCRIDLTTMLKFAQVKSLGFVGENLGAGTNFAKDLGSVTCYSALCS